VLRLSVDLHSDQPRSDDDDAVDDAKLAWRAWMKENIPVADGISWDVLGWWKNNSLGPKDWGQLMRKIRDWNRKLLHELECFVPPAN
jgi:hypothetical protein